MSCIKKLSPNTASAFPSSLSFFHVPPTQVAFLKSGLREVNSLNPVTESPFLFRIHSDSTYIDVSKIFVQLDFNCTEYAKRKVGDKDIESWGPISDDESAPIQGVGRNFIQQLKVSVANDEIYDSGPHYNYRSYLIEELNTPEATKSSICRSTGYFPQDEWAGNDDGFLSRNTMVRNGRSVSLYGRLEFDFANQGSLLLSNTPMLITIYKASDAFLMESFKSPAPQLKFNITAVKLFVRHVELQPSLNLAIYKRLESSPAQYTVRKTDLKTTFLTPGMKEFSYSPYSGTVPRRLCIAMTAYESFTGNDRTPFSFEPFDIEELVVSCQGQVFPSVPYTNLNFATQQNMRPFLDLYENISRLGSPGITYQQFCNGWTIFVVPLSPSAEETDGLELVRTGTTEIRLRFRKAIPAPGVELLVLAETDKIFTLDRDRRVFSDESV